MVGQFVGQDGGGRPQSRSPDRQRLGDTGTAVAPQRHDANQGNVFEPPLWPDGRARIVDHRRDHPQAAQEAGASTQRRQLYRNGLGPWLCTLGS